MTELAVAVERPKSMVADHVKVLAEADWCAWEDAAGAGDRGAVPRLGTAPTLYVGVERSADEDDLPWDFNDFEVAAGESAAAFLEGKLWGFIRHAGSRSAGIRVLGADGGAGRGVDRLPRSGETVYGFAVGVYPTHHPTLPGGPE